MEMTREELAMEAERFTADVVDLQVDDAAKSKSAKKKSDKNDERFYKLLHTIFHVCELAGFELVGRVTLKDKVTNKVWK